MSRAAPRDLPLGFDNADQLISSIESFPERQRFSRLADLMAHVPQHNAAITAYAAKLCKDTKRNVALYRALCQQSNTPADEAWCSQQETKNNNDVLAIEKEIGRAGNNMDRLGQITELGRRIEFASDIGNVQDIHRFVQKQQGYCNTPELNIQACLQAFDALLFAATWDERDTPSYHSIAQQANRADSLANKNLLQYKKDREGNTDMTQLLTEGGQYDLFMEARAAAILGRCLSGETEAAVEIILNLPVRPDKAQVGKLESMAQRWTTPDRFATAVTLCVLGNSNRAGYQAVVNHPEYRGLLETAPQLLDAFNGVLLADFASVGKGTYFAEKLARSDRVMRKQADSLGRLIRKNLVVQFVQPYKVLKLDAIAETFQMSREHVERLLADLIGRGTIIARIDLDSGLLYASDKAANDTHTLTVNAAREYVCDMHQALRMQALAMNKMAIPAKRKEVGGRGGADAASMEGGVIGPEDFGDFDDEEGFGGFGGGGMGMMGGGFGGFGGMGGGRGPARRPGGGYGRR